MTAPLAQLLDTQQDLATSVLSLLRLASLGALSCVSRSMQAVVARQPESLRQVQALAVVCACTSSSG